MSRKYFGTDGIRGRVGEYPITPDFMLKLGWAAGMAFRKLGHCRVLVGRTRVSPATCSSRPRSRPVGGRRRRAAGPMPTPAIAYLTRTFHAEAGIVISASHNPHDDNGIKFSGQGTKLPDDVELMIEELLDQPMTVVESSKLGKVSRINDAAGRYIEFCKSSVPSSTSFAGLKLVVDCAHGATQGCAKRVPRAGCRCHCSACPARRVEHQRKLRLDPYRIAAGCGAGRACRSRHCFDGDGDRVLMVDHTGAIVDGDELLFIIARDLQERGKLQGGVVGTLMSNLGLELALKDLDIPFVRAKVGDRYVMAELLEREWLVGGENSGHVVCCNHTTTGDAIIAALQVLMALAPRRPGPGPPGPAQMPAGADQCALWRQQGRPAQHPQEASAKVTEALAGRGRVVAQVRAAGAGNG